MKRLINVKLLSFVVTFLFLVLSNYAIANNKGTITGKVIDKSTKQPIQYVNVLVVGTKLGSVTDSTGKYTINGIDENIYQLKYSFIGYISHIESEIRVINGKTTTVKEIELSESNLSVDSIIVKAGYFSRDNETPTTNFSYSREEIRRSPGSAGDVFRAIETLPGVSGSGGEFSAFAVRGGSPRDNIVLIDNIPFDKVSHFDWGPSEEAEAQGGRFSIFAPGLIDEANFQAGGFAAKYGGKNASFVDLKLKEGNKESFTVNGSYDLLGWEVNYDGPAYLLNNTSLLLSARSIDFKRLLDMLDRKDEGTPSLTDVIVKTTTELSPKHKLSLLGVYAPEKFDRTLENVFAAKDGNYQPFIGSREETKYLVGANWRWLTNTSSFWENTFYYKRADTDFNSGSVYTDPINGVTPTKETAATRRDYRTINNSDYQTGWKSQFTFMPSAFSTIETGIEVYQVRFDYTTNQRGLDTLYVFDKNDYRPDPAKYYIIADPRYVNSMSAGNKLNANVFLDYKYNVTEQFTVMSGVRYEFNGFNEKSYVSPRFSASYQLGDRTKLNAATGVYYQTPELRIISMNSQNALLENERAIHYIVGVTTYLSDDIKLTAEVYRKDFNNLIVHPDRSMQVRNNAGTGYAQGIDFGLIKKFSEQWYGQVNYSYSTNKRNDNDGNGEYNGDFSQPHVFNILVGYEFNKEWSLSAKWKYATGRPKDSFIVHGNIFKDPNFVRYSKEITGNNDQRFDDFQTLNFRIDYRLQFGRLALVTFLDVLNLYDRLNASEEQLNEITGTIKKSGFRMIPTFGFKLEI
ncbi:MAG: TonB-dependent receptor plug [Stygiobacter sp.]|nr:MAG: TonB-dependent receptor plug [Stygiobacter sp.]KAF0212779.1 MAG: TonB-dependent receptor [Ignavibacteria bacterium]